MPPPATQSQPFTRRTHPDPVLNAIIQDIYDKLQQIQAQVAALNNQQP